MHRSIKKLSTKIALFVAALATVLAPAVPVFATDSRALPGFCFPLKLSVALAEGQKHTQKIFGTYCQPQYWQKGQHQVDVLTEGATYNSSYWQWPQDPALYLSLIHI